MYPWNMCLCVCAQMCVGVFTFTRVLRERKVTNAPTQSSLSLHSLRGQSVLGARCPVASQWAVLSVIPAHEPDSHHKAPIVFAGWIGSHSACHSAATCITRRHSGACFCFWFLLSCQPHRATLFCLRAYLTLISGGFTKAPSSAPTRLLSKSN